jgi:hypothetical protein
MFHYSMTLAPLTAGGWDAAQQGMVLCGLGLVWCVLASLVREKVCTPSRWHIRMLNVEHVLSVAPGYVAFCLGVAKLFLA